MGFYAISLAITEGIILSETFCDVQQYFKRAIENVFRMYLFYKL